MHCCFNDDLGANKEGRQINRMTHRHHPPPFSKLLQLTLFDFEIFQRITPTQFLHQVWGDKSIVCACLMALINSALGSRSQ